MKIHSLMIDSKFILILCAVSFFLTAVARYGHSSQEFYTVQIASYEAMEDARNHYNLIVERLQKENLDFLRIETIGNYFCIRIGKFENKLEADKLFQLVQHHFPSSMIRKAYYKEERIALRYARKQTRTQPDIQAKAAPGFRPDISKSWVSKHHDVSGTSAADHAKNGDRFLKTGEYFKAAEEFRMAIDKGLKNPVTYWKLSEALYEIKFVDEAITELEKAVALSQMNDVLKLELAKLYLVKNRLKDAQEQLISSLRINPCSADLHYYLGEIFLRMKEYDRAWYSAKAAKGLGHKSDNLIRKLTHLSPEPASYPWDQQDDLYIRQILVKDSQSATAILLRIADGELFEDIADTESIIPGKPLGGYMGRYNKSDLHPKISEALQTQKIFGEPLIVETENGFHIVQRVTNFDFNLEENMLAGSEKN